MKNIYITTILSCLSTILIGQKVLEKNLNYKDQSIDIEVKFASSIEVKTWDKSTVYFKADITTEGGKFLDLYELHVDQNEDYISISSEPEEIFRKFREERKKNNPNKKNNYYNSGDEYEFNYIIYAPKGAEISISSINGSLHSETLDATFTADLINGDIDIKDYNGTFSLKTINGEIDLKMDNADLVAETIHGDIYADEHLELRSSDRTVGQTISGKSGSASNRLRLNTINGNMYIRK